MIRVFVLLSSLGLSLRQPSNRKRCCVRSSGSLDGQSFARFLNYAYGSSCRLISRIQRPTRAHTSAMILHWPSICCRSVDPLFYWLLSLDIHPEDHYALLASKFTHRQLGALHHIHRTGKFDFITRPATAPPLSFLALQWNDVETLKWLYYEVEYPVSLTWEDLALTQQAALLGNLSALRWLSSVGHALSRSDSHLLLEDNGMPLEIARLILRQGVSTEYLQEDDLRRLRELGGPVDDSDEDVD